MKPIDWTGISKLHARSQNDIKKDGSYVFPREPLKPTIRNGQWVYLPPPACDYRWTKRGEK